MIQEKSTKCEEQPFLDIVQDNKVRKGRGMGEEIREKGVYTKYRSRLHERVAIDKREAEIKLLERLERKYGRKTVARFDAKEIAVAESNILVSQPFRDLIVNSYPVLQDNSAYMAFFSVLLFGTRFSEETERLMIPGSLVAASKGEWDRYSSKNLRGDEGTTAFLEEFRRDVRRRFVFSGYNWEDGKCREVIDSGIPGEILEARDVELNTSLSSIRRPVCLLTGEVVSRRKLREQVKREALKRSEQPLCPEQGRILTYMNNLPSHRFTKMLDHIYEARIEANKIEGYRKRMAALATLRAIESQPQPFYAPSEKRNTVRVFAVNSGLTCLKKKVRQVLTSGMVDFDLTSCQLAICAVLWEVKEGQEFLRSGRSIWESLFEHFGLDFHIKEGDKEKFSEIKGKLKIALYSLFFGMKERYIRASLTKKFKNEIPDVADLFFSHPLIQSMYEGRERFSEQVIRAAGARDCFGRWIPISKEIDVNSVMAQLAQAVELQLLEPLFHLGQQTNEFSIVLFQHDGVTISFRDKRKNRVEIWSERIKSVVNEQARCLGYPTRLEVD